MSEMKKYSEEEILLSHKGRCISDREDRSGGYCGSASMEIHRSQLNDPKSWVHPFVSSWIRETKPKVTIEQLQDCLQSLVDIQNGSPLIRDEKEWTSIMDRAYILLEVNK